MSRQQQLQNLFQEMDLDDSGFMEADEVNELAQMRRALHHKEGDKTWTDDMNNRLLKKIDTNRDGQINQDEFTDHYLRLFESQDEHAFNTWVDQFWRVVQELHGTPALRESDVVHNLGQTEWQNRSKQVEEAARGSVEDSQRNVQSARTASQQLHAQMQVLFDAA